MRTNFVLEKVRRGEKTFGSFLGMGSATVAELLGHAGCEWLLIEMEHNGLDMAEVEHILMAIGGTDAVPLVRIPSAEPVFIQRSLDIGGMGIAVPMVRTVAEAEAIVRATRYPPEGSRSFGPLRASHYTVEYEAYFERANANILTMLIIETPEAVENLEEIANVEGIDVLFIGAFDLCLSMGLNPFEMPLPEIDAVMERALAVGRSSGKAVGAGVGSPEELQARADQGFNFLSYGPDYMLLTGAIRPGVEAFKQLAGD